MFFQQALTYELSVLDNDNILFDIVFPFEEPELAIKFIEESSIGHNDRQKICH